ncbi:MAG: hypothetical protein ACP5U2_07235 [Bryobacteraceae bacterium]
MANLEKHKKNPLLEWLADEEVELGGQARSPRVVGGGGKNQKLTPRRPPMPIVPPEKPDPALLLRKPAPPPKLEERHSPASSPEHLRKLQRLPRLRAPVTYPQPGARPR